MRSPDYIAAALARALSWGDDHPYAGPELQEAEPRPTKTACARCGGGGRQKNGYCAECDNARRRKGKR